MSLLDLPSETLSQILLSLPVSAIINCAKACKYVKGIVDQDHIWRALCEIIHGVDTMKNKQYSGQWRRIFSEGKAPWINLKDKRYIRKTIQKAKRRGWCIEPSISNEELVLNFTAHYGGSYSPSSTLAVVLMNANNFDTEEISVGFEDKHFKKAGNYLLMFHMDSSTPHCPHGITTGSFTVFKYEPHKLPTSVNEALFKIISPRSELLHHYGYRMPQLLMNAADPELIFYASYLHKHSSHSDTVPMRVDIYDLKTESTTPIKSQKLLGKVLAFSGKHVAVTQAVHTDGTVYLIDWHDFTNEYDDNLFNLEAKNVKVLRHSSTVRKAMFGGNLIATEIAGAVVIWDIQGDEPIELKRIELVRVTEEAGTMCHFDGTFIWAMFCPVNISTYARPKTLCLIFDWRTGACNQIDMSPKDLSFEVTPLYTKHGNFSGKMLMNARGRTDILYTSSPYLAKKFDVAVLTSSTNNTSIIAKRANTIFGNLVEDCKTLIGLSNGCSLTSQVLLYENQQRPMAPSTTILGKKSSSQHRYVLLFEEDVPQEDESSTTTDDKTPLTRLLQMTVLSHHDHSPYGGLDIDDAQKTAQQNSNNKPKVQSREISVSKMRINGACLLMKEEQSSEFGWLPVNLEHNLELLLGDIERDLEKYAVYRNPYED